MLRDSSLAFQQQTMHDMTCIHRERGQVYTGTGANKVGDNCEDVFSTKNGVGFAVKKRFPKIISSICFLLHCFFYHGGPGLDHGLATARNTSIGR